jgi:hypothetical protein
MKITTKSYIEKRRLEQKLIANKKMRICTSASIAANPLLYASPDKPSINLKTEFAAPSA